jgi:PAS domain S-box-containing protein
LLPLKVAGLLTPASAVAGIYVTMFCVLLGEMLAWIVARLTATQQALHASAQQYRRIVETAQEGIWQVDPAGVTAFVNAKMASLLGYTADEMVGRPLFSFMDAEEASLARANLAQRREGVDQFEFKYRRKDGANLWALVNTNPLFDAQGRYTGALALITDITERKRAEAGLQARAHQQAAVVTLGLHALAESDFEVVLAQSVRLVAETLDVEYCEVLACVREDNTLLLRAGVGWADGLVGHGTLGMDLESQAGYALLSGEPVVVDDMRTETRFNGLLLLHDYGVVSGMSVTIPTSDDPYGVLGVHTTRRRAFTQDDVHFLQAIAHVLSTAIERARREELRRHSAALEEQNRRIAEASRLKSGFLANMSHELRTPLNAIMGFAELLYDGKIDPVTADQKEFLGDILSSSRHLLQIINDVLDISKIEAGKIDLHPEQIDVAQLVAEVQAIVRTLVAQKRLRVTTEIDPAVGTLILDPARLKQVLYNYLSNAIKFTDAGGAITIAISAEGSDRFCLAVQDTGCGIQPADLTRLFSEFEQLDNSKARRHEGTGLGLALVKRIVEAQGGRVGVTSAVGQGSRFYAVLPRCT